MDALHQKLNRFGFAVSLPQELLSLAPSLSHPICHAIDRILDQYQLRGAMIENLIDDLNSFKSHLGQETVTELSVTLNLMDETLMVALKNEVQSSKLNVTETATDLCRCGMMEAYHVKLGECEKLSKKIQSIAEQIYLTKKRIALSSAHANSQQQS